VNAHPEPPPHAHGVSAVRIAGDPKGWRLGVIGKRTWTIAHGLAELAREQIPLVDTPLYDEERAVLLHDADVLVNRRQVDLIVEGHAYPPGGRQAFDVSVRVGAAMRGARAQGPRRVGRNHTGRPLFSSPAAVEKIALTWENAYGGVDMAARTDIGDPFEAAQVENGLAADPRFGLFAYPRNPAGRGYVIEPTAAALENCQLPLLESPDWLLTPDNLVRGDFVRWPEGPTVAGFGWLSYDYFPRSALLGVPPLVYDGERIPPAAFHEVRQGDVHDAAVRADRPLVERLGLAVAQSSAIGMRTASVHPNDPVELIGLHPVEASWRFQIPPESPRMYARFAGEEPLEMPEPEIRTVLLQPDDNRFTLVWVAEKLLTFPPSPKRLQGLQHAVFWNR
jgi:hypothetical protein